MSIVELIFNIIFGIINVFLSIIPVISLPSTFTAAVSTVSDSIATLSWLVPIKTGFELLIVWIPLYIVKIYLQFGDFSLRHIPVKISNSSN